LSIIFTSRKKEVGSRSIGLPTAENRNISEAFGSAQVNNDRKILKIEE